MIVSLIGVEHRIHWIPKSFGPEWGEDLGKFEEHVETVIRGRCAGLIGEEFNEECFTESTLESVARRVAARIGVRHVFCEATKDEMSQMAADDLYNERERHWKRLLEASGAERVVFICGDKHVATFSALLRESGHEAEVASYNKWGYGWEFKA